jgi:hypothetical protein
MCRLPAFFTSFSRRRQAPFCKKNASPPFFDLIAAKIDLFYGMRLYLSDYSIIL